MSNRSVEVLTRVVAIAGLTAGCSQIEGLQGTNKPFEVNFSKKTVDSYSPEIAKNININLDNIGSQFAGKYGESYVKDSQGYLFGKNSSGEVFLYSYGNVKGLDGEEVTEWGVVNWADNTVKSDAEIFQPVVKTDSGDIGYFKGEEFVSVMVARDDGKYDLVDPEGKVVSNLAAEEINFWKIKAVQAGFNPVSGETATIEPTVAPIVIVAPTETPTETVTPTEVMTLSDQESKFFKPEFYVSFESEYEGRKIPFIFGLDKSVTERLAEPIKSFDLINPELANDFAEFWLKSCFEAYKQQTGSGLSFDEYLSELDQGRGLVKVGGVDESKAADTSERQILEINPIKGLVIVVDESGKPSVKVNQFVKVYVGVNSEGMLVFANNGELTFSSIKENKNFTDGKGWDVSVEQKLGYTVDMGYFEGIALSVLGGKPEGMLFDNYFNAKMGEYGEGLDLMHDLFMEMWNQRSSTKKSAFGNVKQ